jgi:hypothetical protein
MLHFMRNISSFFISLMFCLFAFSVQAQSEDNGSKKSKGNSQADLDAQNKKMEEDRMTPEQKAYIDKMAKAKKEKDKRNEKSRKEAEKRANKRLSASQKKTTSKKKRYVKTH